LQLSIGREPKEPRRCVPDDLYAELDRLYGTFDTIFVGRTTYDEMVEYWPGAEAAEGTPPAGIVSFVNELKAQPGDDIHLSGGAQLAQTLVRLGLVDLYHLVMHPAVSPGAQLVRPDRRSARDGAAERDRVLERGRRPVLREGRWDVIPRVAPRKPSRCRRGATAAPCMA
jgi:dihydrofolate reductase